MKKGGYSNIPFLLFQIHDRSKKTSQHPTAVDNQQALMKEWMIAATNVPNTQYAESQIIDDHRRDYHREPCRKLICLPGNILENILNSRPDTHFRENVTD